MGHQYLQLTYSSSAGCGGLRSLVSFSDVQCPVGPGAARCVGIRRDTGGLAQGLAATSDANSGFATMVRLERAFAR